MPHYFLFNDACHWPNQPTNHNISWLLPICVPFVKYKCLALGVSNKNHFLLLWKLDEKVLLKFCLFSSSFRPRKYPKDFCLFWFSTLTCNHSSAICCKLNLYRSELKVSLFSSEQLIFPHMTLSSLLVLQGSTWRYYYCVGHHQGMHR